MNGSSSLLKLDTSNRDQIGGHQENKVDLDHIVEVDKLVGMVNGLFQTWSDDKRDIELEWIENERAINSEYPVDVKQKLLDNPSRSDAFVNITRPKVMAAYARILDMLSDKFWSAKKSPKSEIKESQEIFAKHEKMSNQQILELMTNSEMNKDNQAEIERNIKRDARKEAQKEIDEIAIEAAKAMERQINDQLEEGDFIEKLKLSINECCSLGTGAVKAGTLSAKIDSCWCVGDEEKWGETHREKLAPIMEHVSIYNLFLDNYERDFNNIDQIIHRHVMKRHQLRKLGEEASFSKFRNVINEIISQQRGGNHTELQYEREKRYITNTQQRSQSTGNFEVLEYWGWVSSDDLAEYNVNGISPNQDYMTNIWTCGGKLIGLKINKELNRIPFYLFPYERSMHRLWGIAPAKMLRHTQSTLNSATRLFIDNAAMSSAPQVEVNLDLVDPETDPYDISPWKIWFRKGGDASQQMLRFYQPDNISSPLQILIELMMRFADEETSIPAYTQGIQTPNLNKTASGMSMLMGASNIGLKSVIKNIDDNLIKPLITSLYNWNMRWSDDESIKGDYEITARASTTLMAKELRSQKLIQFMQMTANDLDIPFIKRYSMLKELAESIDIKPETILVSEDEAKIISDRMQNGLENQGE